MNGKWVKSYFRKQVDYGYPTKMDFTDSCAFLPASISIEENV